MTDEPQLNPQHPKRTGHRWLDMTVALCALLISTASIFVAYSSNQSMERLTRASSWPFIQLGSGNASDEGEHQLSFAISNVGTGPARVHTFEVQVDGQTLPRGHLLSNMLRACCATEFDAAIERAGGDQVVAMGQDMSSRIPERFLAPDSDLYALVWPRTDQNAELWTALDRARQADRITSSVCYCSVFDECWIAHSNSFPPEETQSCESQALRDAR
jgi:hypothetical protein